ncbi:hypothetical protein DP090_018350 [Pseudomonas sp. MDMC216]|jgi:hypothetical protein|nr:MULTISPECIES: hypothetical protein [Pseudomonas]MBA4681633.1 hypothetical protein [Pseudomonas sp.]MDI5994979.1 hypothetical protein [Pseudomonas sp. MDMC216]MDI6007749.1 hypothetical protein [Pseudomonas sp. MDMC17]RAR32693.1 hypothetical protein DP092_19025 [Pseudomonas sp. MDMC224]UZT79989.1 hypothetical protein OF113_08040 [Pseudomonas chengduensis]
MTKPESVVIPFPTPRNPLQSFVADECSLQSAAEYRAVSLAKLLRRMPESELTNSASTLLSELILLYHLAIAQAAGSVEHD